VYIDDYAAELSREGRSVFAREHRAPVLIGLGMMGQLSEDQRGKSGTSVVDIPDDGAELIETKSLVNRVWPIRKGHGRKGAGIKVGRSSENDVVIPEYSMSQAHCEFRFEFMRITLMDIGSTNGTMLNGKRLPVDKPVPLKDGATLVLGRFRFCFLSGPGFLKSLDGP
jgi:hypothetical protein